MSLRLKDESRENEIIGLFLGGEKISSLSEKFGITRQRVQQIIKRNGYTAKDRKGYVCPKEKKKKEDEDRKKKYKKRDAECLGRTGYSLKEFNSIRKNINEMGFTPQRAYKQHKTNAKSRKIEWKLNFRSWWEIWRDSGKWEKRGRNIGMYVMGRKNDKGPYSKENVEIITCSSNISDGFAYAKKATTRI